MFPGGSACFGVARRALGNLTDAGDRLRDVLDSLGLLLPGEVHLVDELADFTGSVGNAVDGSGHPVEIGAAFTRPLDGFLNQRGGIFGGLGAALGQVADFIGHHGKAQSGFPGAGRFDGRI